MKEFWESKRATELMYWPYVTHPVTGGGSPGNLSPGKASRSDEASSGTSFEPVFIKHFIWGMVRPDSFLFIRYLLLRNFSSVSEYSGKPNSSKALLVLEDAGVYKSTK
jgi:hypothetical protein